jgi:hypothetical protein
VLYRVFIEGCRDTSRGGIKLLADTLGQRYGMSPPTVTRQLEEGRFCARASLDHASAQRLARELEALGANTAVIADGPSAAAGAAPPYTSGLAAAFTGDRLRDDVHLDLGALDRPEGTGVASAGWQLADLDTIGERTGEVPAPRTRPITEDAPTPSLHVSSQPAQRSRPSSTAPPGATRQSTPPPSPGRAPRVATAPAARTAAASPPMTLPGRPREASSPPVAPRPRSRDPFQPPDAGREVRIELADQPGRVLAPGGPSGLQAPLAGPLGPAALAGETRYRSIPARMRDALGDSRRARFAAGIAAAFLIGLVPAEMYALSRAGSAYDDLRADLAAEYRAADTPERWETLAAARVEAAALVGARQRRLAISSGLIWLAVASAAGFAWFRVTGWPYARED